MTAEDDSNLELLLAKAANPLTKELDLEAVSAFHECMAEEPEGPQTALRFLAHRIQSPQEKEALMALLVLEDCVRKSDPRFLNEIGKFRFLNELIKVVSPKYLGNRAPSKVKQKILELMFKWSVELKHESKINEAYQMLRKQGVITEDPVHVLEHYDPPEAPSPRPQNPIFEDEEKSKLLQTLLQSKDPDDLQAANRLIKSMVKEADRRMELMARTMTELEAVHNNAVVLSDMLDHYQPGKTSEEEKDLMKELFESCERLRPKLFRLAGEMDEKDSGLDDILRANDELTVVITKYRKVMGMEDGIVFDLSSHSKPTSTVAVNNPEASLMDLGSPISNASAGAACSNPKTDVSFLDDQLLSLGLNDMPDLPLSNSSSGIIPSVNDSGRMSSRSSSLLTELDPIFSSSNIMASSSFGNPVGSGLGMGGAMLQPTNAYKSSSLVKSPSSVVENPNVKQKSVSGLDELDVIGQSLLKQSLPLNVVKVDFPSTPQKVKVPMSQLVSQPPTLVTSIADTTVFTSSNTASPSRGNDPFSLADILVPLESIQPGTLPPLSLHDKDGLTVVVHFGKDSPRDDVTVMVVSTMSKNINGPFKNVKFQAAVPKTMKIKLQPPSAMDLPPHNPILPPAAITQVMLLANPNKDKVRLKYKITYTMNEENKTEIGEVDSLLATR